MTKERSRRSQGRRQTVNQARHQAMAVRGIACSLRRITFKTPAFKVAACRLEKMAGEIDKAARPFLVLLSSTMTDIFGMGKLLDQQRTSRAPARKSAPCALFRRQVLPGRIGHGERTTAVFAKYWARKAFVLGLLLTRSNAPHQPWLPAPTKREEETSSHRGSFQALQNRLRGGPAN